MSGTSAGAGGGAGGSIQISSSIELPYTKSYSVLIGSGGAAPSSVGTDGKQGQSTIAFGLTATGGSGGTTSGGSNANYSGGNIGGGGAGAGANGTNSSPTSAGNGGNGYTWLDGNLYGPGGAGFVVSNNLVEYTLVGTTTVSGSFYMANNEMYQVNVTSSQVNFSSVSAATSISASVTYAANSKITLRYPGGQKAYGGSNIFASGGFTYHEFASSSQFEVGNKAINLYFMALGGGGVVS